ncbi:MAG: UDP-N-acetylmuramate dehydrogenase [Planctomycetes bacterium]|jgi:UDP-N-acetylmuramate dehydrogenase|nr:UDP-N-acetylmuramate dehydrogenase [Planctomycetota bacterium]
MNQDFTIREQVPLAPLTTFGIGGPAKYYLAAATKEELIFAVEWAAGKNEQVYIIGGGSNLLVNDQGVDGLVLRLLNNTVVVRSQRLEAGAGATLTQAAYAAKSANLSGLEWSIGIPNATVGGAVCGNAGAFGTSMSDLVETVEAFDQGKKAFVTLSLNECAFGYRQSIFKDDHKLIIWQIILKMRAEDGSEIGRRMEENLNYRLDRYPRLPSAGSVFKNLTLKEALKDNPALEKEWNEIGGILFDGKISAGQLIEMAGLKGKAIGGAKVSLEHANHIVNTGRATAADVAMLVSYIKQQVRDRFKIQLQEEIEYFGF